MRIFTISDLHIDFEENEKWVEKLSLKDFICDILIFPGDICDNLDKIKKFFEKITRVFKKVFFVPGNHDLWVLKEPSLNSIEKFELIRETAKSFSISINSEVIEKTAFIPLLGWYDYSFGLPDLVTSGKWSDFIACRWPEKFNEKVITNFFLDKNEIVSPELLKAEGKISFSHFMPRIDLMPSFIPINKRAIYPFLGSLEIERVLREIKPDIHIYGHSHFNLYKELDGCIYINNAFGYPYEKNITRKKLFLIKEV